MAADIKRLNYFTGQFLDAQDFKDEQTYHKEMRWRGNQLLFGRGVSVGLDVNPTADRRAVTVGPGVAFDAEGRELVILPRAAGTPPTLHNVPSLTGPVNVVISYEEVLTDSGSAVDPSGTYTGATHVTETPKVEIQTAPETASQILLAALTLETDAEGTTTIRGFDNSVRWTSPIQLEANHTIYGKGRLHINGEELLLLLNKAGVQISKAWGGTGNLLVEGSIQHGDLYLSGGAGGTGGSSLTYNAHRNKDNNDWVFPNPTKTAVTLEIDDGAEGGNSRLDVFSTTTSAKDIWVHRLRVDGETGHVGIGTIAPKTALDVVGIGMVSDGTNYAAANGRLKSGSLTIGSIQESFGGGIAWSANTAGLLLETKADTEIAVYDSGDRLASLLYYQGELENRLTIGRDMGWGPLSKIALMPSVGVGIGTANPLATLHVNGNTWITGDAVVGAVTGADLHVHGNIYWDSDQAAAGHVRLGNLQIAWGRGSFSTPVAETAIPVSFPVSYPTNALPAVTVSIDDPGYGGNNLNAGAGAYQVSGTGFKVLYKVVGGIVAHVHDIKFSWISIGTAAWDRPRQLGGTHCARLSERRRDEADQRTTQVLANRIRSRTENARRPRRAASLSGQHTAAHRRRAASSERSGRAGAERQRGGRSERDSCAATRLTAHPDGPQAQALQETPEPALPRPPSARQHS
jgi:hypothetical protein